MWADFIPFLRTVHLNKNASHPEVGQGKLASVRRKTHPPQRKEPKRVLGREDRKISLTFGIRVNPFSMKVDFHRNCFFMKQSVGFYV